MKQAWIWMQEWQCCSLPKHSESKGSHDHIHNSKHQWTKYCHHILFFLNVFCQPYKSSVCRNSKQIQGKRIIFSMDRRHFHWKHRTPGEELVDVRWVWVTPLSQCHWSLSHENHVLSYYLLPYKYFLVTGCVCV